MSFNLTQRQIVVGMGVLALVAVLALAAGVAVLAQGSGSPAVPLVRQTVQPASSQEQNAAGGASAVQGGSQVAQPTPAAPGGTTYHVVKAGDTLGTIAKQYGVTTQDIIRANAITDPNLIAIGQRLVIPPH